MKIAKYVGDLLYNYECVVIPGLGGFLTSDKPAIINSASNLFKPPFKQVLFNAYLKTNDGLLINYVAREESIEYKAAKEQVDRFVLLCDKALKEGKRINFHRIGYLYLNKNQRVSFEQDNSVNYNPDAFGLTSFISPAIYKVTLEEKLREKVAPTPVSDSRPQNVRENKRNNVASPDEIHRKVVKRKIVASKRRNPYRSQMIFLSLLIFAMFIGWGFIHKTEVKKYYSNYSSVIPLFYSTPNACLIENINHVPITRMSKSKTGLWIVSLFEKNENTPNKKLVSRMTENLPAANKTTVKADVKTVSQPASKTEIVESKTPGNTSETVSNPVTKSVGAVTNNNFQPVINKVTRNPVLSPKNSKQIQYSSSSGHVFIIAGAFKNESNAEKLIHELRLKGYPAMDAGITKYGLHRVAFGNFRNRDQAEKQLLTIREKENPSAWIFEN